MIKYLISKNLVFFSNKVDVNLVLSKNIYARVEKRDCKVTLFYMDKQTRTVKSCDLIILFTKRLMSF